MTAATDLIAALAPALGRAEDTIHTAVPPFALGGGADVITFRQSTVARVVHVSAGLAAAAGYELILCTREPAAWAPPFLSRLAIAARGRDLRINGTTPLGDPDAPFAGLLFTYLPPLYPLTIAGRYTRFQLALGITAEELAACRSHGTLAVVAKLREAGQFPYSEPGRATVAGVAALGPSPRECPGLSPRAARGLAAVIDGQSEDVEGLRTKFSVEDLTLLAAMYPRLGAFAQKAELVNLTQDSLDPCLHAMWRAVLRDALDVTLEESTSEHGALAIALSGLDGSHDAFMRYWDDLPLALAEARRRQ